MIYRRLSYWLSGRRKTPEQIIRILSRRYNKQVLEITYIRTTNQAIEQLINEVIDLKGRCAGLEIDHRAEFEQRKNLNTRIKHLEGASKEKMESTQSNGG